MNNTKFCVYIFHLKKQIYQNLELIHQNSQEIYSIVNSWCDKVSDVFKKRDFNLTKTAKDLEKHQA